MPNHSEELVSNMDIIKMYGVDLGTPPKLDHIEYAPWWKFWGWQEKWSILVKD